MKILKQCPGNWAIFMDSSYTDITSFKSLINSVFCIAATEFNSVIAAYKNFALIKHPYKRNVLGQGLNLKLLLGHV